jgi:two-component system, OmpR family, sensor kinase
VTGPGDPGRGDPGRADPGRGDPGRGDPGRGDPGPGGTALTEPLTGPDWLAGGTEKARVRPTLASRIALVTIAVAAIAVLISGLVSLNLVRSAGTSDARRALAGLADNVAGVLGGASVDDNGQPGQVSPRPGRRGGNNVVRDSFVAQALLRGTNIRYATVTSGGTIAAGRPADALARDALTVAEAAQVAGGRRVSAVRQIGGRTVFVEARPIPNGGLILAQARDQSAPFARTALSRILISLACGLAVAVVAAVVLARLLARPLKRAAAGAHALATGARDVRVEPDGPAEVAEVADSLNVLAATLRRSEGRQREFLLSVSHELRTPLTAIAGFAESLADEVTTGAQVAPVGSTMLAEARRLERLVSDLLDLARLGADDFRIEARPVDVSDLVAAAAEVWRARCEAVGVSFAAELPEGPLWTVTDATRVRQVIDGLAENALRVTPAGAPIVLGLGTQGGAQAGTNARPYVLLQVRDGGPGLTPEDCAVAFERSVLYERYRGVRRVGTGLGLALVHGLVTRLGGAAAADRAPEGGARFSVWLPLVSPLPGDLPGPGAWRPGWQGGWQPADQPVGQPVQAPAGGVPSVPGGASPSGPGAGQGG